MELNIPIENTSEELKESVGIYKKCLYATEEDLETVIYPSLKYNIYFFNLYKAFIKRINQMREDIKDIKIKLFDYEGNGIDILEEKKKLNEITNNLNSFEKETNYVYLFYKIYLTKVAKKYDVLKNKPAKNVYVNSSEDIIKSQIQFYMKSEKKFLLFKDVINKLKNFLNII